MARPKSELQQKLEADSNIILQDDQVDVQNVAESDLARVAAEEAFMQEAVTILLFPTTDINAPPHADVTVNGVRRIIPRNVPFRVPRAHLEVLARMKETRVSQDMTPDANGEITMASLRGHTGLAYPFSVIEDKNPKGPAWLSNILAERG